MSDLEMSHVADLSDRELKLVLQRRRERRTAACPGHEYTKHIRTNGNRVVMACVHCGDETEY